MSDDQIGYADLIDGAMRGVVRGALKFIEENGLPGDHHCYLTFNTMAPGVKIPKHLKEQYPEEMTIVLQHQYWNLKVKDEVFSVTLSFNRKQETLNIPFASITAFADPSVKFGLHFHHMDEEEEEEPVAKGKGKAKKTKKKSAKGDKSKTTAEVISLDTFRKKDD